MRKLLIVLVLIALPLGGYTAYWFKKADEFKQSFEQSVTALNEQAKTISPKTTVLRYDSVGISGFPLAMTLTINKPIIDIPLSAAMQKIRPPSPTPLPFDWVEEISYGNSIALSGSITGSHFSFTTDGDRTNKTLISGTARHTLLGTTSTPLTCHLDVESAGGPPWTMRPIFNDAETFAAIFRSADCSVSGMTMKDATTGTPLMSSDLFSIKLSKEGEGDANRKISFTAESKNAKALKPMDAIISDYLTIAYTLMGTPENQRMAMIPLSEYGEQNINIDAHYDGPVDSKQLTDANMHMHLNIGAFNVKNALFSMNFKASLTTEPQGNDRVVTGSIHGDSEASEHYDQLLSSQLASMLKGAAQDKTAAGPQAQLEQTLAKLGTPEEVVAAVMPKFHSLGKITFAMDWNGKVPNGKSLNQGDFTLTALDWVATPYGIKFNGKASVQPNKMPSGELTATCLNCDSLVGDLGDYAMRVDAVVQRVSPHTPYVSKDLVESIKQFLHGIAENGATAKDVVIHLLAKETGEFTISGKQIGQILGLYASIIAPHLPQQQPAAATSPPLAAPGR